MFSSRVNALFFCSGCTAYLLVAAILWLLVTWLFQLLAPGIEPMLLIVGLPVFVGFRLLFGLGEVEKDDPRRFYWRAGMVSASVVIFTVSTIFLFARPGTFGTVFEMIVALIALSFLPMVVWLFAVAYGVSKTASSRVNVKRK